MRLSAVDIGWREPRQPPQDGELRMQRVALTASGEHAPRGLLGQSHGFVGQDAGDRCSGFGRVAARGGYLARAQQRRLQREDVDDHIGEIGHDLLLLFESCHEALTGDAAANSVIFFTASNTAASRASGWLVSESPPNDGGAVTSSMTRLMA